MEGWIKLYRKFEDWEWYHDSKMVHLFLHLLINANHKDKKWKGTTIKRGEVLTGRIKLSEKTGISERGIRTCLNRLKSTSEVTIRSTNKFSIITICKFEDYQEVLTEERPAKRPAIGPTNDQQPTTTKNVKKEEKKRNPPTPQGEGSVKKKKENPTLSPEESLTYLPEKYLGGKFEETWIKWWKHRKSEGWTTKVTYTETSLRDLEKLAGDDVVLSRKIIEQSMAKGWAGLFSIKNGQAKPKGRAGSKKSRFDTFGDDVEELKIRT